MDTDHDTIRELRRLRAQHFAYRPPDFDDYDICPECSSAAATTINYRSFVRVPWPCTARSILDKVIDELKGDTS